MQEKKWPDYGKNKESVGELWLGFLRYFLEDFNFERDVVCCRQKKKLLKFEKQWTGAKIAIEGNRNTTIISLFARPFSNGVLHEKVECYNREDENENKRTKSSFQDKRFKRYCLANINISVYDVNSMNCTFFVDCDSSIVVVSLYL